MYLRPLASEASAIVFFSRRTDMPYHYHSSLARLNFSSSMVYEVSAGPSQDFGLPWERCWVLTHTRPAELWVLRLAQLSAPVFSSYTDAVLCVTESCQPPRPGLPSSVLLARFLGSHPRLCLGTAWLCQRGLDWGFTLPLPVGQTGGSTQVTVQAFTSSAGWGGVRAATLRVALVLSSPCRPRTSTRVTSSVASRIKPTSL